MSLGRFVLRATLWNDLPIEVNVAQNLNGGATIVPLKPAP
jgi:hypothetical protein